LASPVESLTAIDIETPFNRPHVGTAGRRYMLEALAGGHHSAGGAFSRRCEALLEELLGARRVLLTTSGTDALELAAVLAKVGPGDEVVLPSFTFVSGAVAFAARGARPVFVDIRPDTLNIDEEAAAEMIGARTRAVVPTHYAGVGCDLEPIIAALERHPRALLIEDNAHGLFGRIDGAMLGSVGALAALSFHETKNISCGEGGALVVNDPGLVDAAEVALEKGTDRRSFIRGETSRYTWVGLGSSHAPAELLAALLLGELEGREEIQRRRALRWERYAAKLTGWASAHGVRLPFVPDHCDQPAHLFYLLLPTPTARDRLIAHLRARGILAVFHYVPLHSSPWGHRYGAPELPVTDRISATLVRLPLYADLEQDRQERVIEAVLAFDPACT
jgi:dTDP-4-amino-4,6-dideoxygalactose transaminase